LLKQFIGFINVMLSSAFMTTIQQKNNLLFCMVKRTRYPLLTKICIS
jgi:hypothetical protein